MSLCPVCGKVYCDHTAEERGQTHAEMSRPLSKEELEAWQNSLDSTGYKPEKVAAARKHAHDPV
ncbi:MAG: hypothetical protein UV65_C0003G0014 [Parcubacteria group bacterium GW2011_GWF2_43_11]|nr:MAG: hypothetical protein UV65_C0003G0014 [Parcubacteria group bacterium GW2011_GWF2_43_11]